MDGSPRPMRSFKKEITDRAELEEILAKAEVLFLALHDEPAPYVLPLNFAYAEGELWFHCAREGTKLDLIRRDPRVGFSAVTDARVVRGLPQPATSPRPGAAWSAGARRGSAPTPRSAAAASTRSCAASGWNAPTTVRSPSNGPA